MAQVRLSEILKTHSRQGKTWHADGPDYVLNYHDSFAGQTAQVSEYSPQLADFLIRAESPGTWRFRESVALVALSWDCAGRNWIVNHLLAVPAPDAKGFRFCLVECVWNQVWLTPCLAITKTLQTEEAAHWCKTTADYLVDDGILRLLTKAGN